MNKTYEYILSRIKNKPEIGIILGSGLGNLASQINDPIEINYKDIPDFPTSSVKGHSGKLIFGKLSGKNLVAMQGRIHYYEGQGIDKTVFPTKILCQLGIKYLIVTNACGGVNTSFTPGDLMIIKDHINFTGVNPLIGPNDDTIGPRFPDQSFTYNKELRDIAKNVAKELNFELKEGVYMWFTGPVYETPAEVRMARIMGADAVGMSTVPEVIVANHRGVKILGISAITNMAAGILDKPLNHEEVIDVSSKIQDKFENLVKKIIEKM